MNGAMLLQHAAGRTPREHLRAAREELRRDRRALVARAGHHRDTGAGALCLIDLKLARLTRDPSHLDSIVDVAGYAACLREVTREV